MAKSLLHIGCGGDSLPHWMGEFEEIRLDIDEAHKPDIVADMVSLGSIGTYDAIYCSHALEHLPPHDVTKALNEFYRVLNAEGVAILFVPDLEGVNADDTPLFDSPAGPICGLDLIYGFRPMLEAKPYMAHRTGFTAKTLRAALECSGFNIARVDRLADHALMAIATK